LPISFYLPVCTEEIIKANFLGNKIWLCKIVFVSEFVFSENVTILTSCKVCIGFQTYWIGDFQTNFKQILKAFVTFSIAEN